MHKENTKGKHPQAKKQRFFDIAQTKNFKANTIDN